MKWRWAGSLNPREYGITKCAYVGVCIWKIHTVLEDSGELCLLNHPLSNDYQIHKSNTYFTWQVSACSAVTVHSVTSYLWDKEVKAQVSNAVSPLKRKKNKKWVESIWVDLHLQKEFVSCQHCCWKVKYSVSVRETVCCVCIWWDISSVRLQNKSITDAPTDELLRADRWHVAITQLLSCHIVF